MERNAHLQKYFKGQNFMTPDLIRFEEHGDNVFEISKGVGLSNNKIFGLTIHNKTTRETPEDMEGAQGRYDTLEEVETKILEATK